VAQELKLKPDFVTARENRARAKAAIKQQAPSTSHVWYV
jgi:hypothetical protein